MTRHRPVWISLLAAGLALAACGDDTTAATDTDATTDADTDTDGTTAGPTSSGPGTGSSDSDSDSDSTTGTTDPTTDPSTTGTTDPSTTDPSTTDPSTTGTTDPTTDTDTDTGGVESKILAGAAWRTLLPEVDGSTAYFDELAQSPPLALEPGDKGADPGVFVDAWDVGTIAIGNGAAWSHWVHDEIRATAVAFQDTEDPLEQILVFVGADVYMLFETDLQLLYDKVKPLVGDAIHSKLLFVSTTTHNHMGPDTSGLDGINPLYFEYLTDQMAEAVAEAVDNLQPAHLKIAQSDYQFGLADQAAPYLVDPTLNTMQAVDAGDPSLVIATVAQWQNHPETVLDFGGSVYATAEQSEYLLSIEECDTDDNMNCNIKGQYISAGFPGYMARHLIEETGAPALYINGAVGAMMSPLRARVWETEGPDGVPAGDAKSFPMGALEVPKSFHKMAVIGWELGKRVLADLDGAELYTEAPIRYEIRNYFTRLAQMEFRVGLTVINDMPLQLGYLKRPLYWCPPEGPKNDNTCVFDDYQSEDDPVLGLPARVGDHARTSLVHVQLGPIEMLSAPGEVVTELSHGLPADFEIDPMDTYYGPGDELVKENTVNHLPHAEFTTPGFARLAMIKGDYKWILGLTMDAGGYILAPADFRVLCIGDMIGPEGTCQTLLDNGIIDYISYDGSTFGLSGARCKAVTEDPDLLTMPPYTLVPMADQVVAASCKYGTTFGEFSDHYEETRSMGWDAGQDWIDAVLLITEFDGDMYPHNPDFIGYNVANL